MSNHEYEAQLYHAMCNKLWTAVEQDGKSDCASLAVDKINQLLSDVRTLQAEVEAWRNGNPDDYYPEDDVKTTDRSGALTRWRDS